MIMNSYDMRLIEMHLTRNPHFRFREKELLLIMNT